MDFIFLDTETTGLDKNRDQILEFACVKTDKEFNILAELQIFIKLKYNVLPSLTALYINHINPFSFEYKGKSITEFEACQKICQFIDQNFDSKPFFISYNIPFDLPMLKSMFKNCNVNFYDYFNTIELDPLFICRKLVAEKVITTKMREFPWGKSYPSSKLEDVAEALGTLGDLIPHKAIDDVKIMIPTIKKIYELAFKNIKGIDNIFQLNHNPESLKVGNSYKVLINSKKGLNTLDVFIIENSVEKRKIIAQVGNKAKIMNYDVLLHHKRIKDLNLPEATNSPSLEKLSGRRIVSNDKITEIFNKIDGSSDKALSYKKIKKLLEKKNLSLLLKRAEDLNFAKGNPSWNTVVYSVPEEKTYKLSIAGKKVLVKLLPTGDYLIENNRLNKTSNLRKYLGNRYNVDPWGLEMDNIIDKVPKDKDFQDFKHPDSLLEDFDVFEYEKHTDFGKELFKDCLKFYHSKFPDRFVKHYEKHFPIAEDLTQIDTLPMFLSLETLKMLKK